MMFLTVEKLRRRVAEIEGYKYAEMKDIFPFTMFKDLSDKDYVHVSIPDDIHSSKEKANFGDGFNGRDKYIWLKKVVTVPPVKSGYSVCGLFDFGKSGSGNTSGFESLLYINGSPYQAVDTNHPDVILDDFAGQTIELVFLLWSGILTDLAGNEEHCFKRAQIGYLDTKIDKLHYCSQTILQLINEIPNNSTDRTEMIDALDSAFNEVDWDDDRVRDSAHLAADVLEERLSTLEKHSNVMVHCIGHTHIDVAWLWRLRNTREKAIRSFSTVLRLMEEYPEYNFFQSQPQLYSYLKQDCPELYSKIKQRVEEGRWEVDGTMWLEADCNVPSGESLVRQMMHGIRFIEDEFNQKCKVLWLPDVFGYSWALPQILKQCGINRFVTSKISWNKYNTMPHSLFNWRGIDGSEVLTYFIDTPEPHAAFNCRFSTYNGVITPHTVIGTWDKFRDKDISKNVLMPYGYGDGGGGVNRNMLKSREVLDRLPCVPNVKCSRVDTFFDAVEADIKKSGKELSVWDGELYLELHRGTYTSQGYNKRANRKAENRLRYLEWLASVCKVNAGKDTHNEFYDAWETILRNQFHDIIPGSSIKDVYEDSREEYKSFNKKLDVLENGITNTLLDNKSSVYTVFNGSTYMQNGTVFVPETKDGVFYSNDNLCAAQRTNDGYIVDVSVPAFSSVELRFEESCNNDKIIPFVAHKSKIETPFYVIEWNGNGQISRIFDKENDREVLEAGKTGNRLCVFEDKPINFDAWDIDIFYMQKFDYPTLLNCEVVECGALRAIVRFTYEYRKSSFVQDMILYSNNRRIDFATKVSWHEKKRLLKAIFPVDVRSTKATYDIQFGYIERPTHYNTSWDIAKFEVCANQWADISEQNYGVSLLNDCKYGYGIHNSTMTLSLLKSSKDPDAEADMGEHEFTYSILPHSGTFIEGDTIQSAVALNNPLIAVEGAYALSQRQIVKVDNPAVQIDAIKQGDAEDCIVVRIHESHGGRQSVNIASDFSIKSWSECDLLENDCGEKGNTSVINTTLRPFEIRTYKLYFN